MKPIWFFVGILLLLIGLIIGMTGIYQYSTPPEHQPVLADLHTSIWWGGIMIVAGLVFLLANRKKTVT
jgi:hypothetical protein